MALSSLSVVTNANRLRRYHPAPLPDAEVADVEPLVQTAVSHDAAASFHESSAHGHTGQHGHTGHGQATGPAATDPVCGMRVDPATAERRDTPTGPAYFCSSGCTAEFDSAPHCYATAAAAITSSAWPAG
jgi:Cu+-exporting ATPase